MSISLEILNQAEGKEFSAYVEAITKKDNPRRHFYYKETVNHAERMGVHVEGHTPKRLLEENRPNEPKMVRDYRISVWKAITESLTEKIFNTVAKIFNPKGFSLTFPENPSSVKDEETLEKYITTDYGVFRSLWIFSRETLLKMLFSDPNSVLLVIPENIETATEGDFLKPLPIIFRSEYVVDFEEDKYFTIYIPEVKGGTVKKKEKPRLGLFIIITRSFIHTWKVKDRQLVGGETIDLLKIKEDGFLPAFRLGGKVTGDRPPYWFKSFIGGVQPHWDKVVNWVSDLDGSIVNHLYPEKYELQEECTKCKGKRNIAVSGDKKIECPQCDGAGVVTNRSPFNIITIKQDKLNPEITPTIPPAGYISKDIEPIRELKESINAEILAGYSSINMEILHKVGENQSGVAKTIDRQDLFSFILRVSNHTFLYDIKNIIELTAIWRNSTVLKGSIEDFLDEIELRAPKNFSVLDLDSLLNELKASKDSGLNSNLIKQIESEIINARFSDNDNKLKKNLTILDLNPFPDKTISDLMSLLSQGAILEKDFRRSQNIDELVDLAIEKDKRFLDKPKKEQIKIIDEIIVEMFDQPKPEAIPVEPLEDEREDNVEGDN